MNRANKETLGGNFGRWTGAVWGALTLLVVGTGSCTDGTTTTVAYAYDNPYLYTTDDPVDIGLCRLLLGGQLELLRVLLRGGRRERDRPGEHPDRRGGRQGAGRHGGAAGAVGSGGAGGTAGAIGAAGANGSAAAGGSGTTTARATLASVIQALARGQNVCPGQVTITPKTATPACAGSNATEERNGATIFSTTAWSRAPRSTAPSTSWSNRAASDQTCSATTTITLGHTTTITNLSISDADGKIVIPTQTDMGMTTYTFGQTPTTTTFDITGEMQTFSATGTMISDLTYTGNDTVTFSGNSSYSVDGTTMVQEKNGPASATINKQGLTRSSGCCRPTGGSVTIDRSGGPTPGTATWTFGPSCGTVMRNNTTAMLPACI